MSSPSTNPIPFWRQLECLSVQSPDRPRPWDRLRPVYLQKGEQPFPWEEIAEHARKRPGPDLVWRYHVQAGIFNLSHLYRQAFAKLGVDSGELERINPPGSGRIFDYDCDSQGRVLPETFSVSLGAVSFAALILHGLDGLDAAAASFENTEDQLRIQFAKAAGAICSDPDNPLRASWTVPKERNPLAGARLQALVDQILTSIGGTRELFFADQEFSTVISCRQTVRKFAPPDTYTFHLKGGQEETDAEASENSGNSKEKGSADDGLINSFFLSDLSGASRNPEAWGRALSSYVFSISRAPGSDPDHPKIDVRSSAMQPALHRLLEPQRFPIGRWPADYPLAKAQQLAINAAYGGLRQQAGLFAVNGPPGTGKTTLLRDLIAAVVTDRAQYLASLDRPESAFLPSKTVTDRSGKVVFTLHALRQEFQEFSILVASSNNGAVENISQEIPLRSALGKSYQTRGAVPNFFAEVATMVHEEPAWAWLAVPLGKMQNRSALARWIYGVRWNPENRPPKIPDPLLVDRKYGLLPWLSERALTPQEAEQAWQSDREAFLHAVAIEERHRAAWQAKADVFSDRASVESKCQELLAQLRLRCQQRRALRLQMQKLQASIDTVQSRIDPLEMQVAEQSVLSLFQAPIQKIRTNKELEKLRAERDRIAGECSEINSLWSSCSQELATVWRPYRAYRQALRESAIDPRATRAFLASTEEERELAAPWEDPEWLAARAQVFLRAVQLHRTFLLVTRKKWEDNLRTIASWLRGALDETYTQSVFLALSLIFPVISSTFAAIQKFLPATDKESIGWLCIDEAGQSTPQSAIGALFRARRAIVVGDPLQLTPIPPVPAGLEQKIAEKTGIPPYWWPSLVSAQVLADQGNPIGTWLPATPELSPITQDGKLWVGSPLRVHRRCLDPMFSISNQLAYDGLMVQGRGPEHAHPDYAHLPETQWIPIVGKSNGSNWIPEEGEALRDLLSQIRVQHVDLRQVFLVSPFREVVRELRQIAREFRMDPAKVGTIHTTQGKEAPIVVLILGGRSPTVRDWAGESPNLLNVAASRAKERLYLIGDRSDWCSRGHFAIAHRYLG